MSELVQANWWLFIVALLIGIAVAWWIFAIGRRTKVERSSPADVLDEGAEPARRNQALIDAPAAGEQFLESPIEPATVAAGGEAGTIMPEPDYAPAAPVPPPPVSSADSDDLKRIKGVGPKLETLLRSLGVTGYAQIAGWTEADIDRIDAQLGNFQGRIRRDNWVEQAKLLAAGDIDGFAGKFGNL